MVSNSIPSTFAPVANGDNLLPGQQTLLLASVMQIPLKKGRKVKEVDPATLQTGMTETGFSEGVETPLNTTAELSCCHSHSPVSSAPITAGKTVGSLTEILLSKLCIGTCTSLNISAAKSHCSLLKTI